MVYNGGSPGADRIIYDETGDVCGEFAEILSVGLVLTLHTCSLSHTYWSTVNQWVC